MTRLQAVTEMDSAHFQKLCRDCGLVDKATGITEIDLVFCYVSAAADVCLFSCHTRLLPHACALTKPWRCAGMLSVFLSVCLQVKTKGARRITFEQFLTALSKLAERKVGQAGPQLAACAVGRCAGLLGPCTHDMFHADVPTLRELLLTGLLAGVLWHPTRLRVRALRVFACCLCRALLLRMW